MFHYRLQEYFGDVIQSERFIPVGTVHLQDD